jgi:hypothetical protein
MHEWNVAVSSSNFLCINDSEMQGARTKVLMTIIPTAFDWLLGQSGAQAFHQFDPLPSGRK